MSVKSRVMIRAVTVVWVSFVSAGIATMLFFATFDPLELAQIATFPAGLDRSSGYSLGFLLFWILLMLNGAVITWLMTASDGGSSNGEER